MQPSLEIPWAPHQGIMAVVGWSAFTWDPLSSPPGHYGSDRLVCLHLRSPELPTRALWQWWVDQPSLEIPWAPHQGIMAVVGGSAFNWAPLSSPPGHYGSGGWVSLQLRSPELPTRALWQWWVGQPSIEIPWAPHLGIMAVVGGSAFNWDPVSSPPGHYGSGGWVSLQLRSPKLPTRALWQWWVGQPSLEIPWAPHQGIMAVVGLQRDCRHHVLLMTSCRSTPDKKWLATHCCTELGGCRCPCSTPWHQAINYQLG